MRVLMINNDGAGFADYIDVEPGTTVQQLFTQQVKSGIPQAWLQTQASLLVEKFFNRDEDDFGGRLEEDVIRVVRHVVQRETSPRFYTFKERDEYDLDSLAAEMLKLTGTEEHPLLRSRFSQKDSLWKTFYKSFQRFKQAVDVAKKRLFYQAEYGPNRIELTTPEVVPHKRHLTDEESRQVRKQFGYRCVCCGVKGKGVRFQDDHIRPYKFGGPTTVDNIQLLCHVCNGRKGEDGIDFTKKVTRMDAPGEIVLLARDEDKSRTMQRLVNCFYRCGAVCKIHIHKKVNGQHYSCWKIELYSGNRPEWLHPHRDALLAFVHDELGCEHVEDITFTN